MTMFAPMPTYRVGDVVTKGTESWRVTSIDDDGTLWLLNQKGQQMCCPRSQQYTLRKVQT